MFFSRAFISLSSAAIVSTYFAVSGFEAELGDDAGLAAAEGVAGAAFLSKQASLAAESDIDLHSGVCAVAVWVSTKIAASMTKNLIINSFIGSCNRAMKQPRPRGIAIAQLNQRLSKYSRQNARIPAACPLLICDAKLTAKTGMTAQGDQPGGFIIPRS
jgi:hypothetical protein